MPAVIVKQPITQIFDPTAVYLRRTAVIEEY